jgi:hypothetical protein
MAHIRYITLLSTTALLALGCERGHCWHETWMEYAVANAQVPGARDLRGIVEVDDAHVVVGVDGFIARMAADRTWTTAPSVTSVDLLDVAHDDGVLLAVGPEGTILRSSDGGLDWAPISSGTNATLHDVDIAGSLAWAVGDGVSLHSLDAGQSWSSVALPVGHEMAALRGVVLDDGTVWAVGLAGVMLFGDAAGSSWSVDVGPEPDFDADLWDVGVAGVEHAMGLYAVGDNAIIRRGEEGWYVPQGCDDWQCDYQSYVDYEEGDLHDPPPAGEYRAIGTNYIVGLGGQIVIVQGDPEIEQTFASELRLQVVADGGGDLWSGVGELAVGEDGRLSSISASLEHAKKKTCIPESEVKY